MITTPGSTRRYPSVGRETQLPHRPATILTGADLGWDDSRRAWSLAAGQRPAAVAVPRSVDGVAAAVRLARDRGLRVAARGTGHNAAPLGYLAGMVLVIKTYAMRHVAIDPAARVARAGAGVIWQELTDAAATHGLAGLAGSLLDVGVVGYALGGGMSLLGRAYGLSATNVEAIELVTADGSLVRTDAAGEPDLFWALSGGGGSFGVVTAVELRLFAVTGMYAGLLWWPFEAASQLLHAWRELTRRGLPDAFTTTARLMKFPISEIPEPIRGRSFALVDVTHLGSPLAATELRHLGGEFCRVRPGNGTLASVDAGYALYSGRLARCPSWWRTSRRSRKRWRHGRRARCTSISPRPAAPGTRPASGIRRPTTGCAASRPPLTRTT
jgi:FAD/FMN-containing dehydrogenase